MVGKTSSGEFHQKSGTRPRSEETKITGLRIMPSVEFYGVEIALRADGS